jgi:outer membrane cobalamin receptor
MVFAKAKSGVLTGKILDATSNEPLPGARIAVVGTRKGAISGFDGSYKLTLDPGDYSLKITYVSYLDSIVKITVTEGRQTLDVALRPNTKEVTVNGKSENGSEESALLTMRNSDNIINAVSARTIEISPDISVADAAQRLSGVTMTRTAATGDAEYAIIRGMDERYNYTTVNGIKVPSPDNKNLYVPLDIFPAALLDRLEVTKTLTPSMEGDATGGVVNMVMKQAPDHAVLSVEAGTGYSDIFSGSQKFDTYTPNTAGDPRIVNGPNTPATISDFPAGDWAPRQLNFVPGENFSATIGNRFGDNQQFGIIAAGSFQNSYRGANTLFFTTTVLQTTGQTTLEDFDVRQYSTFQSRWGGMVNMDYRADENNTIQLFGMYASLDKQEVRNQYDTLNHKDNWPTEPEVDEEIRTSDETQTIANATLSGKDVIFGKDLSADWHLAYSRAVLNSPDEGYLELIGGVDYATNPATVIPYTAQASDRVWENGTDDEKSAYLTLKSTEDIFGTPTEFSYGGMYRNTERVSTYDDYSLRNINGNQYFYGDPGIDTFQVYNPFGTGEDPLDYTAYQNITAGFVQAKFPIGPVTVVGGVRSEITNVGWVSSESSEDPGKTGTDSYIDLLPSVNLKYDVSDNQDWRASYFKSISRPTFYELIPNGLGVPGDDYTEYSNDSLNRAQIDNFDLRWEYFPGGLDQLLIGAFYKHLHDPIEWEIVNESDFEPENLGDATNYGLEVDFRKFFSDFGISGNYTYTDSRITTNKVQVNYVQGVGATFDSVPETRPLEGQAANIGNLSALYKNFESGTEAQVSAVYTGTAIVGVSTYVNDDIWQQGFLELDLSGEQRIAGNLVVYLKVTNLLNSPREEVIHQLYENSDYAQPVANQTNGQDILVRKELYDRTYLLGLRFKM